MTRPATTALPRSIVAAGRRDAPRLLLLSLSGLGLLLRASRRFRLLVLALMSIYVLEAVAIFIISPPLVLLVVVTIAAMLVATVVALLGSVAWRLLDPRRVVLMSADRTAVVDVLFLKNRLSLANHTRLRRSTAAPALRDAVADWLRSIPGGGLRFLVACRSY